MGLLAVPEYFEPRFKSLGPVTIGTAVDFHLQDAQIEAHLDFIATIFARDNAHRKMIRIVLPAVEDRRDIF